MTNSHYHPFQKLCPLGQRGEKTLLLGALGPYILVFDLDLGTVLSRWPDEAFRAPKEPGDQVSIYQDSGARSQDEESPNKRRKTSPSIDGETRSRESSVSIEILSERTKGQRRKKKTLTKPNLSKVSHVMCTSNGEHVIAVTAEDKCISVFELNSQGRLEVCSERCMPKRLCTIALTKKQSTILAGDKFGDVYALPLLPSQEQNNPAPGAPRSEPLHPFKASASELTVHTKGNREALRQQQIQKAVARKKQEPAFEHHHVLGHVSLLTDLAVGVDPSNESREYILTGDRDEHIRVSRGVPQAHVINNYCLGHTDFVSKLCILSECPQYLVSGGGEPYLRIWDWINGAIVAEASLVKDVSQLLNNAAARDRPGILPKRAVSCIQPFYVEDKLDQKHRILIVVALEGTPSLATYEFDPEKLSLKLVAQCQMSGNVLDIVTIQEKGLMLVSLDNVHSPLSMKRPNPSNLLPAIDVLTLISQPKDKEERTYGWIRHDPSLGNQKTPEPGSADDVASKLQQILQAGTAHHGVELGERTELSGPYSQLGEFLYGLENLRKKVHGGGDGDGDGPASAQQASQASGAVADTGAEDM